MLNSDIYSRYKCRIWNVQTATHVCLITDFCPGGELFLVLERQPKKHFHEESARFGIILVTTQSCVALLLILN